MKLSITRRTITFQMHAFQIFNTVLNIIFGFREFIVNHFFELLIEWIRTIKIN